MECQREGGINEEKHKKIIICIIILFIVVAAIVFKYGITINTYNKTGFTVFFETYTDEAYKKDLEYYKMKDFENMKKLDYEYTKFFEFPDEEIICEYIYFNRSVIYEGSAKDRNIYAVLCKDKTIKYIVDGIGTFESIEDRYNYEKPNKERWVYSPAKTTQDLELTNEQYNKIINLLKLLKLYHTKDKLFNFESSNYKDLNVIYMEGHYYNFTKDDRFISSMIENALEDYLREILYEASDFPFEWRDEGEMLWNFDLLNGNLRNFVN